MARQHWRAIARDYPEYIELSGLLVLASDTWQRFGISAAELAEMDEGTRRMIEIALEG